MKEEESKAEGWMGRGRRWGDSEGGEIDDDRVAKGQPASRWTVKGQAEMNPGGLVWRISEQEQGLEE